MAPTDNTGASVGAAPAADVLQWNLLGLIAVRISTIGGDGGGGSQFGEQDSIGRKQLQQILTAAMIISTIRRRSAILSHVVRARIRTGTGRNGHRGAAAAASAATATGNRGRGLILLLLPLLNRHRRLPVVMIMGMNPTYC